MVEVNNVIEITPQRLAVITVARMAEYFRDLDLSKELWWFAVQDLDSLLTAQLVAFLAGTMQIGALNEKHQEAHLKYYNDSSRMTPFPNKSDVTTFEKLLIRASDPNFPFINNKDTFLNLSDTERTDILKLHKFRNNLTHPQSTSWMLETAGLPRMSKAALAAFRHLFSNSSQRVHLSLSEIKNTEFHLDQLVEVVEQI